jgi:hypothetical protein
VPRFRAHKYVINADIKEMFLQFCDIYKSNRDLLTFLRHKNAKEEPMGYVNMCHVFRVTCLPRRIQPVGPEVVKRVKSKQVFVKLQSLHIDDYYEGGEETDEVVCSVGLLKYAIRYNTRLAIQISK